MVAVLWFLVLAVCNDSNAMLFRAKNRDKAVIYQLRLLFISLLRGFSCMSMFHTYVNYSVLIGLLIKEANIFHSRGLATVIVVGLGVNKSTKGSRPRLC